MKELQIFNNPEFGQIRMLELDGKPYAVGSDVAKALGYAIPHKAVRDNCKGVLTWSIPTNGGKQEVLIIPEGDIYRLIVKAADQSRNEEIKAKAERFEKWIFDEVLPQLRQTGTYSIKPVTPIQALQQTVNILAEQEKRLQSIEAGVQTLQYRIENLDATDIEGDLQQRLNKMIRKYAFKNGLRFNQAWADFKQAYNTAFRTNLELKMNNYAERNKLKSITIPQYLALTDNLEDAVRVADKMLNKGHQTA